MLKACIISECLMIIHQHGVVTLKKHLAYFALVGAFGDMQGQDGFKGVNKLILDDAKNNLAVDNNSAKNQELSFDLVVEAVQKEN